jgi:hypothetical protein
MHYFKALLLLLLVTHLYAGQKADFAVDTSKDKTSFSYVIKPPEDNRLTLDVAIDPAYLVEPDKNPGIDIVLLIDNTGSMGHIIEMIKTQIDDISSFLLANYPNVRIAIASVSDHTADKGHDAYRIVQDLTDDPAVLKDSIADLRLDKATNNDYPEAYLYGLSRSLELEWRKESQKILFFIGDAWAHDPDKGLDKTPNTSDDLYAESVLDDYQDRKIQICSYYVDERRDAKIFFKTLSHETNGFLKPVKDNSDVKNDFKSALQSMVGLNYSVNNPFVIHTDIHQNENHFLFDFNLKDIALDEHKLIKVLFTYNNGNIGEITIRLVPGRPWGVLISVALLLLILTSWIALRFVYKNIYTTTIVDYAYLRHYAVLFVALLLYAGLIYLAWMAIDTPDFPIIWNKLWW